MSPVLDVPELFWSEATLGDLYSAVRDYMEITGRVEALNEKLGVANDLVSLLIRAVYLMLIHIHSWMRYMTISIILLWRG